MRINNTLHSYFELFRKLFWLTPLDFGSHYYNLEEILIYLPLII